MSVPFVKFTLKQGYIDNWLVAGPQLLNPGRKENSISLHLKENIANRFYVEKLEVSSPPVERGPLDQGKLRIGNFECDWNYFRCDDDHLVDISGSFEYLQHARAWAYTHLYSPVESDASLLISFYGPVDVWVNKKIVYHSTEFSELPVNASFPVHLAKGENKIVIRFANLAQPACVLAVSLQVEPATPELEVHIPTLIPSIERRNELEEVFQQIYFERDVNTSGDLITLVWPEAYQKPAYADARLQTPAGRIYGQAENIGNPGDRLKLGTTASLNSGPYQAYVTPLSWELYESHIRMTKKLNTWATGHIKFSTAPYGTLEERSHEALRVAAAHGSDLFGQIALAALGKWNELDEKVFRKSFETIKTGQSGSGIQLIGLLGFLLRFQNYVGFPTWARDSIHDIIISGAPCFTLTDDELGEDPAVVPLTCQVLAGHAFSEDRFNWAGQTGAQLHTSAEEKLMSWMRLRGRQGFGFWSSKQRFSDMVVALSHLVDMSETEEVWELASVLLDKIFLLIALNSFDGVYGVSQGWATPTDIKAGFLEPTSGITRVLWGIGFYSDNRAGTVSISIVQNYELAPIIAEIAATKPVEFLNKELQSIGGTTVHTVSYRTPNYMLSSAQDYCPGRPGKREHIWQATLGPKSVVFVNHPGNSSEGEVHMPGFWLGNAILPRVAQYQDTLVSIYQIAPTSRMKFTHAFFPQVEFDEYILDGNTAYARKGAGYIALTAINGLEQVTLGKTAYRELRSPGQENIWICQMGRSDVDGDFKRFKEKCQAVNYQVDGQAIGFTNIRGQQISFGWEQPLILNGVDEPLHGSKHIDNPYASVDFPSQIVEVNNGEYLLRLDFRDPEKDTGNLS